VKKPEVSSKTEPLKPFGDTGQVKEIAQFDSHIFYVLDANPMYANKRFFTYITKWEQISTLTIPNDYILAIKDTLQAMDGAKFERERDTICNLIDFTVKNRGLNWYHTTIALIESFILVDDEDVKEMSVKHNKIKRECFQNNPEARFFFTNIAAQYIKQLPTDLKDTDLEAYMTKTLKAEPHLVESIMKGLHSDPFGIFTKKD